MGQIQSNDSLVIVRSVWKDKQRGGNAKQSMSHKTTSSHDKEENTETITSETGNIPLNLKVYQVLWVFDV